MAAIDSNALTWLHGHWQTALSLALMVIAIAVGVPIIYRIKREVSEEAEPITERDVLSELEQAHAAGELDDAELRRVRELLRGAEDPVAKPSRPTRSRRGPESAPHDQAVSPPADAVEPPPSE